jgi:hypothetical protein
MIRRGRIERVDPAHAAERFRMLLEDRREIAIVVAVMDHLDEYGSLNAIRFHQVQQHFRRGVALRNQRAGCKRKMRIVFPHMDVWIDDVVCGAQNVYAGGLIPFTRR